MKNFYSSPKDFDVFIEKNYNGNSKEFILLKCVNHSSKKKRSFSDSDSLEKSLSRSKRRIREISLCNNFEYFYTQTFSPDSFLLDRYDLESVISLMKKKFKAYQRKNKDFKYLVIYEHHKDGAVHLHGLLKNLGDDLVKNKYGYLTLTFFNDLGFNSLSPIRDLVKCSNYITKYITKDMLRSNKNQCYFCSRGLLKPSTKKIDFEVDKYDLIYYNDYCKKFKLKGDM